MSRACPRRAGKRRPVHPCGAVGGQGPGRIRPARTRHATPRDAELHPPRAHAGRGRGLPGRALMWSRPTFTARMGRGGWTWYTGAAGWFYRVALESIGWILTVVLTREPGNPPRSAKLSAPTRRGPRPITPPPPTEKTPPLRHRVECRILPDRVAFRRRTPAYRCGQAV